MNSNWKYFIILVFREQIQLDIKWIKSAGENLHSLLPFKYVNFCKLNNLKQCWNWITQIPKSYPRIYFVWGYLYNFNLSIIIRSSQCNLVSALSDVHDLWITLGACYELKSVALFQLMLEPFLSPVSNVKDNKAEWEESFGCTVDPMLSWITFWIFLTRPK